MAPLKFSIITVCFNAAETIERTIRSICSQTYPHIEFIIVDGASTDKTLEIVSKYACNVDKLVSEKDYGIYDAMNKGIAIATGDVVYFLNADDCFCDDNVVSDVATAFMKDDSRLLVYGKVKMENVPEKLRPFIKDVKIHKRSDFLHNVICHQAIFAKRSLFSVLGGFDCQYHFSADYDWTIRVYKSKPHGFYYVERNIANFFYTGRSYLHDSVTRKDKLEIQFKHLFSPEFIWYYFRYVLIRNWKKRLLNEKW